MSNFHSACAMGFSTSADCPRLCFVLRINSRFCSLRLSGSIKPMNIGWISYSAQWPLEPRKEILVKWEWDVATSWQLQGLCGNYRVYVAVTGSMWHDPPWQRFWRASADYNNRLLWQHYLYYRVPHTDPVTTTYILREDHAHVHLMHEALRYVEMLWGLCGALPGRVPCTQL